MAGRTRLFQAAGSPLIQGHSRNARSFLSDWVASSLVGCGAVMLVLLGVTFGGPSITSLAHLSFAGRWFPDSLVPLGVVWLACAVVVGVGKGMGWARLRLLGAAVGIVAGLAAALL
jgi:hypothetical protein